jgi:MFS family permease
MSNFFLWHPSRPRAPAPIPRTIWALGFVSLFMDVSSEMIHSVLPIFVVSVLGVSAAGLGVMEGIAEAAVMLTKMISGALSDALGKRKALALWGYGLAALTKPLFALAPSFGVVFGARLIDRIGKGIREAPRDALIGDVVGPHQRGASFGLRQALDTAGALLGPLGALLVMLLSNDDFRLVFWLAVPPAFIAVAVLARFVKEPRAVSASQSRPFGLRLSELRHFSRAFWATVAIGAAFTLARFSEAFLLLRARGIGLDLALLPLVMMTLNAAYVVSAYPAGRLSDLVDRRIVLAAAAGVLVLADMVLAAWTTIAGLMVGTALWGLHMGLSQGLFAALIVDHAPRARRGTAFGLFSLVSGLALLAASVGAGQLWDRVGPATMFYAGAALAALTLGGLLMQLLRSPSPPPPHSA